MTAVLSSFRSHFLKRPWILLCSVVFFCGLLIPRLSFLARKNLLNPTTVESNEFRSQPVSEELFPILASSDDPGRFLGLYWLETRFQADPHALRTCLTALNHSDEPTDFSVKKYEPHWENLPDWNEYLKLCRAIWNDLRYFPVATSSDCPDYTVTFENSWQYERTYGGERRHEGIDIMASVNQRGIYPIVSMTDGTIQNLGWLELGGYRIGILAPGGAYFYYAHLDSYAPLTEGQQIHAGDLLGYMGDTGYSKTEGTTGRFPVHLHLGIYLTVNGREVSVNSYPALRLTEQWKVNAVYE